MNESAESPAPFEPPKGVSYWTIVRRQFRKDRLAMAGLWMIGFLVLVAVAAPLLANDRPIAMRYKGELLFPAFPTYLDSFPVPAFVTEPLQKNVPFMSNYYPQLGGATFKEAIAQMRPGDGDWSLMPPVPFGFAEISPLEIKLRPGQKGHVLGTDDTGADILARMIHGTIISLSVGVVAVGIYVVIGILLGAMAGYFGGWVDYLISRAIEVMICFPTFFLIIAVIAFLPRSIYNIMIVIGITSWPGVARLIRGEVLKAKSLDYVLASRAIGSSSLRTIFREILPNTLSPVLVTATFGVAGAILIETSLSFLGFGVAPPTASWGEIVSQGRVYVTEELFHMVIWPGLAICLTLIAFNLVGQGLRDAMDPRLRDT
jgi:peptide/nickel transport system permease protein